MAHIHLPEGALPLWAVALWSVLAAAVLAYAVYGLRRDGLEARHVALGGMVAAASFAVFQVNIPVLGGVHLSLTALVGILVGPSLGAIVAFVVNVLSALLGHGAWGFLGANTLVGATEAAGGYYVFAALRGQNWDHFPAAALATIAGLGAGSLLMGAIPIVSGIRGVAITGGDLAVYMAALVAVNLGVAVIEGLLTGSVVRYIASIRPDLLGETAQVSQE
ncbi:cobalt ABC transporter permease [Halodesulfurarchaeum formicicum]|uniref:Cobalt ABC transporter permease n=1 Tax=Halodesulfurarchaeum formicicum TaxID=1873524 RepID=A0A1D8S3B6_9EURY|nr:energy-coupling factor ABC transporter permease [Halodesulfurarchaeum formicicum]AOW79838.1 cobalt ABC transporter permease [Halodesulfurarchaeum formicicum]APE95130.1 cobalt ABC transporter permease [Halodesulfurarchaeum formicicum]